MSLRALKKRDSTTTQGQQQQQQQHFGQRATLFKKSQNSPRKFSNSNIPNNSSSLNNTLSSVHSLEQQRALLGRATRSNPELLKPTDTLELLKNARLVRTKSESDVSALLKTFSGNANSGVGVGLIGAKSEVCLQTISVHNTAGYNTPSTAHIQKQQQQQQKLAHKMLSGARSHRDLTQSCYGTATDPLSNKSATAASSTASSSINRRRMSESSMSSAYSQRTSAAMSSSSALTYAHDGGVDRTTNSAVRVPIIGYEVMEERARFTVYKLRVENPFTNDCWLVLRRYTDFVRLNTKLKQLLPNVTLLLPRKKIFGDNFNAVFLDNRVQGLQMFVNSIMSKEELRKCKLVREFFCLDEPPTYSESMEECRAIFEAQEETIAHLKMQINSKNDLILNLQQKLRDEMLEKDQLKEQLKNLSLDFSNCSSANNSTSLK